MPGALGGGRLTHMSLLPNPFEGRPWKVLAGVLLLAGSLAAHPHFSPAQMLKRVREIDTVLALRPPKSPKERALLLEEQAQMLFPLGRVEEGIASMEEALELQPKDPTLYYNFASLLLTKDLVREALPYLRKGAALAPKEPRYTALLAQALERTKNWEEAGRTWERAALQETDPSLKAEKLGSAARCLEKAGKTREAEKLLDQAVAATKKSPLWYHERALFFLRAGKFEKSAADLARAVKVSQGEEGDVFAWLVEEGEAWKKAGKEKEAARAFQAALEEIGKSLREDPAFAEDLYFHQARALFGLGRAKEAAQALKKALEILPGEPPYLELGLKIFRAAGMGSDLERTRKALAAEQEKEREALEEDALDRDRRLRKARLQVERARALVAARRALARGGDVAKAVAALEAKGRAGQYLAARVKALWDLKRGRPERVFQDLQVLPARVRNGAAWAAAVRLAAWKALGKEDKARKDKELLQAYLDSAGR